MIADGVDVAVISSEARAVLASAATVTAGRAGVVPGASTRDRDVTPPGQDELLRLISVTGAIRVNADVLPQSLRDFVR